MNPPTHITPPPYVVNHPDGFVTAMEHRCRECSGSGLIWNPVWKAWTEQWKDAGEPNIDAYSGDHPVPEDSEEIPCGECDGSGYVLTTPGRALVDFLRRHRI